MFLCAIKIECKSSATMNISKEKIYIRAQTISLLVETKSVISCKIVT